MELRKLARTALLLAMAATPIILIFASLLAPWYGVTNKGSGMRFEVEYTLYEETTTANVFGGRAIQKMSYSNESFQAEHGNVSKAMAKTRLLTLAVLPCAVAHLMSTLYVLKRKGNLIVPAGIGLGVMAAIFVVPIFFALTLPGAFARDATPIANWPLESVGPWSGFFARGSDWRMVGDWGPRLGWYLVFAAGFVTYAGSFIFLMDWNKSRCRKATVARGNGKHPMRKVQPAKNLVSQPTGQGSVAAEDDGPALLEIPKKQLKKEG